MIPLVSYTSVGIKAGLASSLLRHTCAHDRAYLEAKRAKSTHAMSDPTIGVHQTFLSPTHSELNIAPDTMLGRDLFAARDRQLVCASPKTIVRVKISP